MKAKQSKSKKEKEAPHLISKDDFHAVGVIHAIRNEGVAMRPFKSRREQEAGIRNVSGEGISLSFTETPFISFEITWVNAKQTRPKDGEKIIFEDAVGLFWGVYHPIESGKVFVHIRIFRCAINWENISQWIPYPKEKGK